MRPGTSLCSAAPPPRPRRERVHKPVLLRPCDVEVVRIYAVLNTVVIGGTRIGLTPGHKVSQEGPQAQHRARGGSSAGGKYPSRTLPPLPSTARRVFCSFFPTNKISPVLWKDCFTPLISLELSPGPGGGVEGEGGGICRVTTCLSQDIQNGL